MKIAIFHNLTSGGGKRALEGYCKGLCERGHSLDLFIMDTADERYLPLDRYTNLKKIYSVKGRGLFKLPDYNVRSFSSSGKWLIALKRIDKAQRQIADNINKGGYDLAFIGGCIYTQAPFILRYLKTPSVYLCQEPLRAIYESPKLQDLDNLKGRVYLLCASLILKKADYKNICSADLVLANSYFSRESILKTYGINARVNYLGVDTEEFKPLDLTKENMVISLGGLQPRKGYRFIIQFLSRINKNVRPKFVILADKYYYGEGEVLKNLAKDLKVELDIVIGSSDEAVIDYYNRAKAVVFAPYLEPFGFVALEAMACGAPLIAVKEGGIREVVIDGQNGILLDRDEAKFAEAIERVLGNPDKAQTLGLKAREYVEKYWSWDKSVDYLEHNFETILYKH